MPNTSIRNSGITSANSTADAARSQQMKACKVMLFRFMRTSTWIAPVFEGNTSPQAGNYSRGSMWLAGELLGVSITDIYSENVGSAKNVTGVSYDDITLTRNTNASANSGLAEMPI